MIDQRFHPSFRCVISTLCAPNLEYQLVNPTTQVSLFSYCVGTCSRIENITWNVYQGSNNASANVTQWTLFPHVQLHQNSWFFGTLMILVRFHSYLINFCFVGRNTSNFTSTNQLFMSYPWISFWRFEVAYTFADTTSSSSLNFIINQPPANGSCSISPSNGTTTTVFTISCPDWLDQDDIKEYSLYSSLPNEMIPECLTFFCFQLGRGIHRNRS